MASFRSTRAASAVDRLKRRTGNAGWSMSITGEGYFFLSEKPGEPPLSSPLELDEFVAFVNKIGPQEVRRMTKSDIAFEKQLVKKTPGS